MTRRLWILLVAVFVLNVSLAFVNVWPTPVITWRGALSIELCVALIAGFVLTAGLGRVSPAALRGAAILWALLVLGRYGQVTAPALYGRDVNLYWDLRFVPDVVAMAVRVAPWWLIAATVAGIGLVLWTLYVALRLAIGAVADGLLHRGSRMALLATAVAALAWFVAQRNSSAVPAHPEFADATTPAWARQAGFALQAMRGSQLALAHPAIESSFEAIQGSDVLLMFVESYGAATYDRPEMSRPLEPSRLRVLESARETGRDVVSAFVTSPTFGGESWLAHITLMSGVEVHDPQTNAQVMAERRDTLAKLFSRHGYRTVAMMPGLQQTWPEGSFYGFDQIYGATQLAYRGPQFGWFEVPDQFTLDRLRRLELDRADRAPLFAFFPTISTHFPFSPTPPYQADWSRVETDRPYDLEQVRAAYSDVPDWTNFAPGYVRALAYDLGLAADFLRLESTRDLVMILIGDHQPASAVAGEGARWDVPVHVIASRPAVLERLEHDGFVRGMEPARASLGPMSHLLTMLLDAFGSPAAS
jgi:Sulfatase